MLLILDHAVVSMPGGLIWDTAQEWDTCLSCVRLGIHMNNLVSTPQSGCFCHSEVRSELNKFPGDVSPVALEILVRDPQALKHEQALGTQSSGASSFLSSCSSSATRLGVVGRWTANTCDYAVNTGQVDLIAGPCLPWWRPGCSRRQERMLIPARRECFG